MGEGGNALAETGVAEICVNKISYRLSATCARRPASHDRDFSFEMTQPPKTRAGRRKSFSRWIRVLCNPVYTIRDDNISVQKPLYLVGIYPYGQDIDLSSDSLSLTCSSEAC